MDESYIKVKGEWKYLYRAVDKAGDTVDFLFRAKQDEAAARRCFEKAIAGNGVPETVTIDKIGANRAGLNAINADREVPIKIRQSKYLNNVVEQDQRAIKRIVRPMLGFKSFRCAHIILGGIELMHMIAKGQMKSDDGRHRSVAEQFYDLAKYAFLFVSSRLLPIFLTATEPFFLPLPSRVSRTHLTSRVPRSRTRERVPAPSRGVLPRAEVSLSKREFKSTFSLALSVDGQTTRKRRGHARDLSVRLTNSIWTTIYNVY
jgi:hypothetical protein